ncbi:MAG: hypothetical protein EG825_04015 [Rhodocyclaceae bacterium]|nr:hypothetical protein [Rhodocyclaceae bacterium]
MRLPLVLPLGPSRILLFALATAHGLAALALLVADLSPLARLFAALPVLFSAWHTVLKKPDDRPLALSLKAEGVLELYGRSGDGRMATVSRATTVFPWLIILLLKTDAGRLSLCLPRDALGVDGHRQLRMWLAWLAKAE